MYSYFNVSRLSKWIRVKKKYSSQSCHVQVLDSLPGSQFFNFKSRIVVSHSLHYNEWEFIVRITSLRFYWNHKKTDTVFGSNAFTPVILNLVWICKQQHFFELETFKSPAKQITKSWENNVSLWMFSCRFKVWSLTCFGADSFLSSKRKTHHDITSLHQHDKIVFISFSCISGIIADFAEDGMGRDSQTSLHRPIDSWLLSRSWRIGS